MKGGNCVYGIGPGEMGASIGCYPWEAIDEGKLLGFVNNPMQCPADISADSTVAEPFRADEHTTSFEVVGTTTPNSTDCSCPDIQKAECFDHPWLFNAVFIMGGFPFSVSVFTTFHTYIAIIFSYLRHDSSSLL